MDTKADLYESLRVFIHDGRPSDPIVKAALELRTLLVAKDNRDERRVRMGQVRSTAA